VSLLKDIGEEQRGKGEGEGKRLLTSFFLFRSLLACFFWDYCFFLLWVMGIDVRSVKEKEL